MGVQVKLNNAEWKGILEDFAKRVTYKQYSKVNYNTWRKIAHIQDCNIIIDICKNWNYEQSYEEFYINLIPSKSTESRYTFTIQDDSLGQYLWDHVVDEWDYIFDEPVKDGHAWWCCWGTEYHKYTDNLGQVVRGATTYNGSTYSAAACPKGADGIDGTVGVSGALSAKASTADACESWKADIAAGVDGLMASAKLSSCDDNAGTAVTAINYDDYNKSSLSGIISDLSTHLYYDPDTITIADRTTVATPCYNDKISICGESITNKTDILEVRLDECARLDDLQAVKNSLEDLKKSVEEKLKNKKEKEESKMKGINFEFGPCDNTKVRMSMYGLAVKNAAGTWVSYNPKAKEVIDVDVLNFDGAKYMYKMPVALKDVAVGDVIVHNHKPMFVTEVAESGKNLTVVDVFAGEEKHVIPTVNMFGFNFVTKVVSLFNTVSANAPSPDAPFGNMLPLLMMSESGTDKIDPMMLMLMMGGKMDMSNPLMLYFMMKDGGSDKDMGLLMAMSMMNGGVTPCMATGAPLTNDNK